jgi:hypothetical protein
MQGFLHSLLVLLFPYMVYTFSYVGTIVSEVPTAHVSRGKFFGTVCNHLDFITRTVTNSASCSLKNIHPTEKF